MKFLEAIAIESQGRRLRFRFVVKQMFGSFLTVGTQFSVDGVSWGETSSLTIQIPWPRKADEDSGGRRASDGSR